MTSPFDFFEEIWCINLDHRTDRRESARKQFESIGILGRVKRFSAIKHTDGRVGCIKSFVSLLEYAKEKKLENILIFEDDVKFINNPLENLRLAVDQSASLDWNIFYFGATTHTKLIKIKPNVVLLRDGLATHASAYHKSIFDIIINRFKATEKIESTKDILDVYLKDEIQTNYTCLLVNPIIATQATSYSDVEKRNVNYAFIEERFKTYIK